MIHYKVEYPNRNRIDRNSLLTNNSMIWLIIMHIEQMILNAAYQDEIWDWSNAYFRDCTIQIIETIGFPVLIDYS